MARKTKAQKEAEAATLTAQTTATETSIETKQDAAVTMATTKTITSAVSTTSRSRIRLQNASRNIQFIPFGMDDRKRLLPNETWDVDDDHVEAVKKYLATPYFKNLLERGAYKLLDAAPTRLGELELQKPQTPEPPDKLTERPANVIQAEFIQKEGE